MARAIPTTRLPSANEQTGDQQLDSIQTNQRDIKSFVNGFGPPPVTLGPVTFTAGGSMKFIHRLGRMPTDWYATDVTGGYGSFKRLSWDSASITIQSQNACTATFKIT